MTRPQEAQAEPRTTSFARSTLEGLLRGVSSGELAVEDALERLADWPGQDLGHTRIDTQRELRCGAAEVVYGAGKSPEQLVDIVHAIRARESRLLVTRASTEGAAAVLDRFPDAEHHASCRLLTFGLPAESEGEGSVLIVCAGTSDLPVAEEALLTARMLGARAELIADVGVAGLHRILGEVDRLKAARAVVVVAGMEGALPSVVGGLVEAPVIAVPTSVGYGASFGGLAALLGMLNSCASGVSVVNIDNGFGGGYSAALINRGATRPARVNETA